MKIELALLFLLGFMTIALAEDGSVWRRLNTQTEAVNSDGEMVEEERREPENQELARRVFCNKKCSLVKECKNVPCRKCSGFFVTKQCRASTCESCTYLKKCPPCNTDNGNW